MAPPDVLVIGRSEIARTMTPADWLEAADRAFRAAAERRAKSPEPLHIGADRGGFHVKAASISLQRSFVAVKVNGNFPNNPTELGLPTVQGAIILSDGSNGALLAILDSIEVTLRRTAAASALAAKLLARPDSVTMLVCGCGAQGRAHVEAMREVLPLESLLLWDREQDAAETMARDLAGVAVTDLMQAAPSADVIVCCTSSQQPFLLSEMVAEGTFIAAVGADNPDKSELEPRLMGAATVVVDSLTQCAAMGDLHHAIDAGVVTEAGVHAELADVLVGSARPRSTSKEVIIFDSTGTALLDVAASSTIYERAMMRGMGHRIGLGAPGDS